MKTTIVSAAFAFLICLCVGCKKGDTGPAGPTGATGTANVKYSSWSPLSMNFSTTDSVYEQVIKADSLTEGILDSGLVLTYFKINSSGSTQIVNADLYMDERFTVGSINLFSQNDFTGLPYRYILIPGGMKVGKVLGGGLAGYTKDEIKAKSYDEIIKLLGESK